MLNFGIYGNIPQLQQSTGGSERKNKTKLEAKSKLEHKGSARRVTHRFDFDFPPQASHLGSAVIMLRQNSPTLKNTWAQTAGTENP